MNRLLCISLFFFLAQLGLCDFLIPPNVGPESLWRDNPQYRVGEAINLTWTSDQPTVDLILEMQFPNKPNTPGTDWKVIYLQRSLPASNYRWIVDLGSFPQAQQVLDENGLAVLFLTITRANAGPNFYIGRSHYFNITNGEKAALPSTTPTTLATTSQAPASPTVSAGKPNVEVSPSPGPGSASTNTPATTPNESQPPSVAVIGGAVGGGVAAVGAMMLVAFFLWRKRSKRKKLQVETYKEEPLPRYSQYPPQELPVHHENHKSHEKVVTRRLPAELSHQAQAPVELPAGSMYNAF